MWSDSFEANFPRTINKFLAQAETAQNSIAIYIHSYATTNEQRCSASWNPGYRARLPWLSPAAGHCCPPLVEMLSALEPLNTELSVWVVQNLPFDDIPKPTEAQMNSNILRFHPQQAAGSGFGLLLVCFYDFGCFVGFLLVFLPSILLIQMHP